MDSFLANTRGVPWTDEELRASVDAYLYLLRLERHGVRCREGDGDRVLRAGPLSSRNEGSIRYRMRNISAVIADFGATTLLAYSPAAQVGSGVKARIAEMLHDHPIFRDMLAQRDSIGLEQLDRAGVLDQLHLLRQRLNMFEGQLAGIGHNNPPEQIAPTTPHLQDIRQAKADVDTITAELSNIKPDVETTRTSLLRLKHFGLKLAMWVGERTTKFVDAALVTAAPIAVATATDLMPVLIEVVRGVGKLIGAP